MILHMVGEGGKLLLQGNGLRGAGIDRFFDVRTKVLRRILVDDVGQAIIAQFKDLRADGLADAIADAELRIDNRSYGESLPSLGAGMRW